MLRFNHKMMFRTLNPRRRVSRFPSSENRLLLFARLHEIDLVSSALYLNQALLHVLACRGLVAKNISKHPRNYRLESIRNGFANSGKTKRRDGLHEPVVYVSWTGSLRTATDAMLVCGSPAPRAEHDALQAFNEAQTFLLNRARCCIFFSAEISG